MTTPTDPPEINALTGDAPQLGQAPAIFDANVNTLVGGLPALQTGINAVSAWMNGFKTWIGDQVAASEASAEAAATSELIAKGAANYQGDYDLATTYAVGESLTYDENQFVKKSAAPAGTTPVDGPDWLDMTGGTPKDIGDLRTTTQDLSADGWLKADGAVYLQSSYAALFAQLGQPIPFSAASGTAISQDPDTALTGQVNCAAFDANGERFAVGLNAAPYMALYRPSATALNQIDVGAFDRPSYQCYEVAWSPDNDMIAASQANSPWFHLYKITDADVVTKVANPLSPPSAAIKDMQWSPDGTHLAVGYSASPYLRVYKRNGDVLETLNSQVASGVVYGVSWSADSNYIAVGCQSGGVKLQIYKLHRDSGTALLFSTPAHQPQWNSSPMRWSPGGNILATCDNSNGVLTYTVTDGVATFADAAQLTQRTDLTWDADGQQIILAGSSPEFLTRFLVSDTGELTRTDDPTSRPGGIYRACAVAPNNEYFVAGSQTANYMHFYRCFAYDTATEFPTPKLSNKEDTRVSSWIKSE